MNPRSPACTLPRVSHRPFKQLIYPQFARIAQALASDRRLELLDLLAQAPRHVEALAAETEMSVANVSQHLQTLRAAHLVDSHREGTRVIYRLAGEDVRSLWLLLRTVAEERLPEISRIVQQFDTTEAGTPLSRGEVMRLLTQDEITVLDVRPAIEFASGHIPGAISIDPAEMTLRLAKVPRDRPVLAYCRGAFCHFADEAVVLLRAEGCEAYRMDGGWLEWSIEAASGVPAAEGDRRP